MAVNVPTKVKIEKYSRYELLAWVNDRLPADLDKIEQLRTGAAYCHFIDMLFPNSVNLKKVKYGYLERDYIHNFKLLQAAFANLSVVKDIPIEKLIKGRMQDNLVFLQWFRRFFDANYSGDNKDEGVTSKGAPKSSAAAVKRDRPQAKPVKDTVKSLSPEKDRHPKASEVKRKPSQEKVEAGGDSHKSSIEAILRRDRDFFYSKLRDIELICLKSEDIAEKQIVRNILGVLYAFREGVGPRKSSISKKGNN